MSEMAKVTRSGGKMTVELPKACWLDADEVAIRWEGRRIVLEDVTGILDPTTGPIVE